MDIARIRGWPRPAARFQTGISAIRNLLGFIDYRHRSVDFRQPPQRSTIRSATEKYHQGL